jgi:G6PDH family F420-dependent oxidoreductase
VSWCGRPGKPSLPASTRCGSVDHFHPWNGQQGHSPFVWSVIGALSEVTSLPVSTAVTCPIMRIHPAVVAQAAATAAVQCEGRFVLGVGSGEALNEHVVGHRWPPAPIRQDMLEEAVGVIRELHTGREVSHHGRYFTVEDARLYTVPEQPVPIYVSGFGPRSVELAARIGDGYCTTAPDAGMVQRFRDSGGGSKPVQGGMKMCWAETVDAGMDTTHRLWPNSALPGQLAQTLPTPQDFEQASTPRTGWSAWSAARPAGCGTSRCRSSAWRSGSARNGSGPEMARQSEPRAPETREPGQGIPAGRLSEDELLQELDSIHRTRHDTFLYGSTESLATHTARMQELAGEYLRRHPERQISAERLRAGARARAGQPPG